ncbi:MAG: DUF4864 domain-containing protein [Pseudomonadota bacterium]
MARIIAMLGVCLVLATGAWAQSAADDAVQDTIQSQIEAFKADDFDRAFTFASPMIQGLFRTPENFGAMVRGGYPMVWRPAQVRYLELREVDGRLWQKVEITDASGRVHLLDYQMINFENGWKINGVQLLQSNDLSA